MTWTLWKSIVQAFVERPSIWICLMFSSWLKWRWAISGESPERLWSALLLTLYSSHTMSWYADPGHWLRWCLSGFSTVQWVAYSLALFFFPVWKNNLFNWKMWNILSHFLKRGAEETRPLHHVLATQDTFHKAKTIPGTSTRAMPRAAVATTSTLLLSQTPTFPTHPSV